MPLALKKRMNKVLAAIDLGPSSARVLYHAAGFARLLSTKLRIIHVVGHATTDEDRDRVRAYCLSQGPYEVDFDDVEIVVEPGIVSNAIIRESIRQRAELIVMGSRGRGRLAKLILGSTCEAVLRGTAVPVLLVPPTDVDIVNIADRASLTCGPVLAAVDLSESSDRQLMVADDLACMAGKPLLLMTVAPQRMHQQAAGKMLRERGHHLSDHHRPHALIVRRGDVAEQISLCAREEGAGLVVMGLRTRPRAKPGAIASAVLQTNRAFVLAVPNQLS